MEKSDEENPCGIDQVKQVNHQSSIAASNINVQKSEDDSKKATRSDEQKILTSKEKVQTNRVKLAVISAYCRVCTWYMTILVLFFTVMSHAVSVATNLWLAKWSSAESDNANATLTLCDVTNSPGYAMSDPLLIYKWEDHIDNIMLHMHTHKHIHTHTHTHTHTHMLTYTVLHTYSNSFNCG